MEARPLLYTMDENDFGAVDAMINPTYQLKDVPEGTQIAIAYCIQMESEDSNGNPRVVTTLIDKNGDSYQTLSDFVDRLITAAARARDPKTWKDNPVTIQMAWRKTNSGKRMLAPKLIH